MVQFAIRAATYAAFLLVLAITINAAPAQEQQRPENRQDRREQRQHQPGQFDFYVLALSWSPSFCQASAERGREAGEQCGTARPYSFVVHGLWPQYERGFPRACQVPAPRLNRELMSSMLDLMPAPRLVYSQWDSHGTCSGLNAQAYFDLVRKARGAVKIPDNYEALKAPITVDPDEVEDAFVKANPGLDLKFRDCAEIDRRACRRDKLIMPPVRGGELIRRTGLSDAAASLAIARPAN